MLWHTLLVPFVVTSILIELTPGPNMAYLAMLSAERGRAAGLAAVAGIAVGLLGAAIAAALGLAALIESSRAVYEMLRWAGAAYLLWLAWEGWRGGEAAVTRAGEAASAGAVYFRRGLVTNLLNPKAYVFYIAVLPRFVDPGRPPEWQTLTLSLIYVAVATVIHAAIALLAGAAEPYVAESGHAKTVRRGLALALAAVAVWLLFATKR
jgi:threonine/homoserine/homoserine lactone efflux protein